MVNLIGSSEAYKLGLSWNRAKVIRDLNIYYDENDLLYFISELSDIDFKVKTGKLKQDDIFNYFVYTIY